VARLGIDYGTTNTVVVSSDRGHYPVVPHTAQTAVGSITRETFSSLAVREAETGRFLFGPWAERALGRAGDGGRCHVVRSPKRWLRDCADGAKLGAEVIPGGFDPAEVLQGFSRALHASIRDSGLFSDDEPLEAVLTVPANANGAQRYVTRRCLEEAGFRVLAMINEPTASAIEYADRVARGNRAAARQIESSVAVFDLGGGTFDVSLVTIDGPEFTVIDTAGIEHLGGDDFDDVLARLFAEVSGIDLDELRPFQRQMLLAHCRRQKESIDSGSVRSLLLVPRDLGLPGDPGTVPVAAYFDALSPLLEPALRKLVAVAGGAPAGRAGIGPGSLDAIYLVGGSSKLPLVRRLVAERFPETPLVASDKPFSATAMGAAIRASEAVRLQEILARTFGVIRPADEDRREVFDPIFPAGTRLPARGEPVLERRLHYTPRHNIGHLRYLECASVDARGWPEEGVRAWSEALFPYDPSIPIEQPLEADSIVSRHDLQDKPVSELYSCDPDGFVTVRIVREVDGRSRTYEIFRPRT
jgi:molecular chaperone DnaK (HSP70)